MAQLIFVHGVATRPGRELDAAQKNMRQLFATTVFGQVAFEFYTPLWGDLVPVIPPGVFATEDENESFSISGHDAEPSQIDTDSDDAGLGIAPAEQSPVAGLSVGSLAAAHPELAIDSVLAALVDAADKERRPLSTDELAMFALAVDSLDEATSTADLTANITSDASLADALEQDSESYDISLTPIKKAIATVTDRIRNVTSDLAFGLVRGSIRPAVGLFSGDVFAYLKEGTLRDRIRERVRAAIKLAWQARSEGEPLVIVGHSMGGVILVDMLADLAGSGLPDDLVVSCLFTVGSQPSLFQAVGALAGGAPTAEGKVAAPTCVAAWINVFDPIDPLAFQAEPVFDGVRDLSFNSITGVASAHTTYFKRPQFYARFRSRLGDLNLLR